MTYCAGILVEQGLVVIGDTRTNAGLDNVSTFRKLHVFAKPGERVLTLASAGNLSMSQSVISLLHEGIENPDTKELETIDAAPSSSAAPSARSAPRRARASRTPSCPSTSRSCSAARSPAGRCAST
jgi:putative proteasome-type protease